MAKIQKTVCDEASLLYEAQASATWGKAKEVLLDRAKRLRAEGRKIRRYERLIVQAWGDGFDRFQQSDAMLALAHAAKRIQKARTK